ncbi:hypothetical protein M0R45_028572 [Rubus argutus]|uniref:Uncharacterized protein n=1 Tax=Rubus argutus TaxID=59490 RepID=A0AAW1W5K2_RUBAR
MAESCNNGDEDVVERILSVLPPKTLMRFNIVSVSGGNKLESRDKSSNAGLSLFKYSSSPLSHSMLDKRTHLYSVWAIPPDEVSVRVKKVMESLRAESMVQRSSPTFRSFYYQCVSLLIASSFLSEDESWKLWDTTQSCAAKFGFCNQVRPHLSLLYGYLTEEEKRKAREIIQLLKSWEKIAEYPLRIN